MEQGRCGEMERGGVGGGFGEDDDIVDKAGTSQRKSIGDSTGTREAAD